MRATTITQKLGEMADRAGWSVRTCALAMVLVGALAAYQLAVALTAADPTPEPDVAAPSGADGGSPPFLEPPRGIPDPAPVDRSDRPDQRPEDASEQPVSMPGAHGIPATVLRAYQGAEEQLGRERPGCGVSVPLLAAIGRVESNHARGGKVDSTGRARPPIIGLQLNGRGVATIRDTDGGRYDGDTSYDRAVGPMQFIPSTWARWGADGNGDGVEDPQNVYDATVAAGRYLCAAGGNLNTPDGQRRAILAYNHSDYYLKTVLSWMRVYSGGAVAVPDGRDSRSGDDARAASMPAPKRGSDSGTGGSGATGSSKPSASSAPKDSGADEQPIRPPEPAPDPVLSHDDDVEEATKAPIDVPVPLPSSNPDVPNTPDLPNVP